MKELAITSILLLTTTVQANQYSSAFESSDAVEDGAIAGGILIPIITIMCAAIHWFKGDDIRVFVAEKASSLSPKSLIYITLALQSVSLLFLFLACDHHWSVVDAGSSIGPYLICDKDDDNCEQTYDTVDKGKAAVGGAAAFQIFAILAACLCTLTLILILLGKTTVFKPTYAAHFACLQSYCSFVTFVAWASFHNDVLLELNGLDEDDLSYGWAYALLVTSWVFNVFVIFGSLAVGEGEKDATRSNDSAPQDTSSAGFDNAFGAPQPSGNTAQDDGDFERGDPSGLPPGWEAHIDDETGDTYYFHQESGTSSWDVPTA